MAITWQATDTIEPAADTDIEQAANAHLYGVIAGCAVTFDAADMTYDVAAGQILHNGVVVNVSAQANAGTLTADGTNPRWAYIYLDSTGVEGLTHGTAAADPAKPEIGDNVAIAAVLIAAGATIANSQTTLDKRVWTHKNVEKYKTATQVFSTNTTYADITTSSGNFAFPIAANEVWRVRFVLNMTYGGTGGVKLQLTGPAAPTAVFLSGRYLLENSAAAESFWYAAPVISAFSTGVVTINSGGGAGTTLTTYPVEIEGFIQNGTTAGTVTLQGAQNSSNSTTTFGIGSFMKAERVGP